MDWIIHNWVSVLGTLLTVSEGLSIFPIFGASGILKLIVAVLKAVLSVESGLGPVSDEAVKATSMKEMEMDLNNKTGNRK